MYLPIGKRETFKIFAHVGLGYYFGTLKHTTDIDGTFSYESAYKGELSYWSRGTSISQLTENTSSNSLGYHGGLGLDIKLTRLLSFGAEVYGRHVEFDNWKGSQVINSESSYTWWSKWTGDERLEEDTYTDSAYGKMWTYEIRNGSNNETYAQMEVVDEEPDGSFYQNVRKSSINLNSYGFSFSVKLSFNLF